MATKVTKPKNRNYGVIQRGTSLTIPVTIRESTDKPLDLTEYTVAFTAKRTPTDFDREDSRAYIAKTFKPQEPERGAFFIRLSSKDTDFETGEYYFDIELTREDGAVYRLCTLFFTLEGGPTNRTVNGGLGQLPVGDEVIITTLEQGTPIIITSSPVAASAEYFARVDELTATALKQEQRILEFEEQLEVATNLVNNYAELVDLQVNEIQKLKVDLYKAQQDIQNLEHYIARL